MPHPIVTTVRASLIFASLAGLSWGADEQEVKLTKEDVPAKVLETLQKAANGSELGDYEREVQHGKTVYTATFKQKDGKEMEITVDPEGKLIGVEAEHADNQHKEGKKPKE